MMPDATTKLPAPARVLAESEYASYSDIVSDADQVELHSISESMTEFQFRIGDIAARISRDATAQGFRVKHFANRPDGDVYVTQQQIDDAVGHFCHREGRTVRYYREVAQFFPPDVRAEFASPDLEYKLDFNMFVVARSFREQWRDVLEFAAVNPQMSKDAVRTHFIEQAQGTPPDVVCGDETADERAQASGLLALFSRLVDAAHRAVQSLPLSDDQRHSGILLVAQLREWIADTADELKE